MLRDTEVLGASLAGKYRLESVIGRGGMGTVYRAVNEWTQQTRAIKFLRADSCLEQRSVQRFLDEGRSAAALGHPNVVEVVDMGRTQDGRVYLVMEYLEGESLAVAMRRRKRLDVALLKRWLVPVTDAVAEAHAKGIIHRDIKPENIFLARGQDGETTPKLLDFGIAKVVDKGSTSSGAWGTPAYMAPEQALGEKVGPAADIWSLGVVIYECLTGELPFDGHTPFALLSCIVSENPVPLSSLKRLDANVRKLLAGVLRRDPRERLASAAVLRDLLAQVPVPSVHGESTASREGAPGRPTHAVPAAASDALRAGNGRKNSDRARSAPQSAFLPSEAAAKKGLGVSSVLGRGLRRTGAQAAEQGVVGQAVGAEGTSCWTDPTADGVGEAAIVTQRIPHLCVESLHYHQDLDTADYRSTASETPPAFPLLPLFSRWGWAVAMLVCGLLAAVLGLQRQAGGFAAVNVQERTYSGAVPPTALGLPAGSEGVREVSPSPLPPQQALSPVPAQAQPEAEISE